jgi:FSR family fosmidomycin resistance protein-like MFS transporter
MFGLVLATYVGSAAYHPSGTGVVGALSTRRTGLLVGVFLAGGYLGYSLSQVLFSALFAGGASLTPLLHLVPVLAALGIWFYVPRIAAHPRASAWPWREMVEHGRRLGALFAVQVLTTAVNVGVIFLLPDLLLARHAPAWMVQGGGHFALVAGGCLSLLPGGHAADRYGARRVLVVANLATGVLLALLLFRDTATWMDVALVAAFGAFNGVNNVVTVSEGNRIMTGRASAASALLMGLPWCLAAMTPAIAGTLADPSNGGTPAGALRWIFLTIPAALVAAAFLGARQRREAHVEGR